MNPTMIQSGILKNFYANKQKKKGPVSQMNDAHPMIHAIRIKRDQVKTK